MALGEFQQLGYGLFDFGSGAANEQKVVAVPEVHEMRAMAPYPPVEGEEEDVY